MLLLFFFLFLLYDYIELLILNNFAQEAYLLNLSPWQNLIFGCANAHTVDPERVRKILEKLEMKATLKLIEEDLEKQKQFRNKPLASAEESEEAKKQDVFDETMARSQKMKKKKTGARRQSRLKDTY